MTAALKAVHLEDPVAAHVREILAALGEDPRREGLARTPARYAKAMRFLAGGYAGSTRAPRRKPCEGRSNRFSR
jgi:GTP cyclohydrolase I